MGNGLRSQAKEAQQFIPFYQMLGMDRTEEREHTSTSLRENCYPAMYNLIHVDQEQRKEVLILTVI